jgi:ADP-ribosylglycohydrolase
MAIFWLAKGDPETTILYGANFGRDADTIGTMVGGLAGVLHGAAALPRRWVEKVEANEQVRYRTLAPRLADFARQRATAAAAYVEAMREVDKA